jgi:periplasmic divalent cation tolerance protein
VTNDSDLPILIMVTAAARDDAERLGETLVVERLAASCSVVPTVHSFYFSDGLLQREHEALLLVRTLTSKRTAVMEHLDEYRGHSRPEILEVQVSGGSAPYLDWLSEQMANPGQNR